MAVNVVPGVFISSSATKTKRNDPCPCGSGRKYKRCCLVNEKEDRSLWHRQNRLHEVLPTRLLKFAVQAFGEQVVDEAWDAFVLWDKNTPEFDPETVHMPVFMPWFFYDWTIDAAETDIKDESLYDISPAALYLRRRSSRLEPIERRCIQASLDACFSFHEITAVRPGESFTLRDLIGQTEVEVTEHMATQSVSVGDILFARVVQLDGALAVLDGSGPVVIPASEKPFIAELRGYIDPAAERVTPDMLREIDFEMLEIYHELTADQLAPRMPELRNSDGDDFRFYEVIFDIDSPQIAYDKLGDLQAGEGEPIAEYDSDGALYSAEIIWLRDEDDAANAVGNTVLGVLSIEGDRLTVDVNSENRAQEIRERVELKLGAHGRYRTTVIQSIDAAMAEAGEYDLNDDDDLADDPEMSQALAHILQEHYDDWPFHSLPALAGQAPADAVKDVAGREQVETLLVDIEQTLAQDQPQLVETIMPALRAKLGLRGGTDKRERN